MADANVFLSARTKGILATQRVSGRPQLSNIIYGLKDGVVRISVTEDRAKTKNMRRDPRSSLHVTADDFWSWVVVDCDVELGPVAQAKGDIAISDLRALYLALNGEHPDWAEFEQAMITDRRLVASLHPVHAYGQGV